MSDQFTPEQNFELQRQKLVLSQASREQLIEFYIELLKLHYRHLKAALFFALGVAPEVDAGNSPVVRKRAVG